jgi:hypothetical protein
MDVPEELLRTGRAAVDFLSSHLDIGKPGAMALGIAVLAGLGVVALAYLLISRIRKSERDELRRQTFSDEIFRTGAVATAPRDEPDSLPGAALDLKRSEDLQKLAASFEDAIGRLAAGGRERHARMVQSQEDLRGKVSMLESTIESMTARIAANGARYAEFDERFEALAASIVDLEERLDDRSIESRAGIAPGPPLTKLSAEIAEIVRELQDS